jgi:MYXO-CTERM domain-containing protein
MKLRWNQMFAAVALAGGMAAAQAGYSVTLMDLAGGSDSTGWDISNTGVFVGNATVAGQNVGYLINGGVTTTLSGPAGAVGTGALGISDGGVVVGNYYTTADGTANQGLIYDGSSYTTLNLPGATDTLLRAISPNGRYVTGYAQMADSSFTSFVYDRTTSSFTTLFNSPVLTIAQGVTDAGIVVGNHVLLGPTQRLSFTYNVATAAFADFSIPGGDIRYRGINESGLIDGFFQDGTGRHGFIGDASSYKIFNVGGGTDTVLEGINNAGWLAGQFTDDAGIVHAFLAQPVSEPASWALMAVALGGLAASRRRRA